MTTKLQIVDPKLIRGPLVRYADACAAIEALEDRVDQMGALERNRDGWRDEALKYENRSIAAEKRIAELEKQLERMALVVSGPLKEVQAVGRWDGPAKVL